MKSLKTYLVARLSSSRKQKCSNAYCKGSRLTPSEPSRTLDSCPICLEEGEFERVAMLDGCGHAFCQKCALDWISENSTCPLCRHSATMVVSAHVVFAGADRERLFRRHMECYDESQRRLRRVENLSRLGYLRGMYA